MSQWVEIGKTWLNLDLVLRVELLEAPQQPGKLIGARVHYDSGQWQDFADPQEIQDLATFLRSHRAP